MNASSAGRPPLLIFHVNDNTDDQVLLQAAANAAGVPIEWHVAGSAEAGISYLRSLVELSPKYPVRWPGLVVLELLLHGVSGLKVLEYIRSTPQLSTLPVVVLTGNTNPATRQEADRLGVNSYHEKPGGFDEMVRLARLFYNTWSAANRATQPREQALNPASGPKTLPS